MAIAAEELLQDQDWRALGACATSDPDIWFAVGAREHQEAKKICRRCPVRLECLSYAMDAPVDHGVWGGMTERERRRYRRKAGSAGWRALLEIPDLRPTRVRRVSDARA